MAPEPEISEARAKRRKGLHFQTGLGALIMLVACCGVVLWAARHLWESQHPALGAARGLQAKSPSDRIDAIRQLEHVGSGDAGTAIPALIGALNDPESDVRVAASEALGALISDVQLAGTADAMVRDLVTTLIGSLQDPDPEVRVNAARALERMGSLKRSAEAIESERTFIALTAVLGDENPAVRIAALNALAVTARKTTAKPPAALASSLADESAGVRNAAIKALARFPRGLDNWIPGIFDALDREAEPRVRDMLVNNLIPLGPPTFSASALPALIAGLSSRYPEVQRLAESLLSRLGPEACPAIPDLIKMMSYPIDSTIVPGGYSSPKTIVPGSFQSPNWDPASEAANALGKIAPGTPSADEVIRALTELVRAGHPDRQFAAADALGHFGSAAITAVPSLIDVIKANVATKAADGDGASAATALGLIAPGTARADDAVNSLILALGAESEYTRENAIGALARFGPRAIVAVPRLRALLHDEYFDVCTAAARALAKLGAADEDSGVRNRGFLGKRRPSMAIPQ